MTFFHSSPKHQESKISLHHTHNLKNGSFKGGNDIPIPSLKEKISLLINQKDRFSSIKKVKKTNNFSNLKKKLISNVISNPNYYDKRVNTLRSSVNSVSTKSKDNFRSSGSLNTANSFIEVSNFQ